MKIICNYCYSTNVQNVEGNEKCTTCGAPLNKIRNMEKIKFGMGRKAYFGLDLSELYSPYEEMEKHSFVHLFRLLKIIRQRKQETYKTDQEDYAKLKTQSLLIENIMFDKGGYSPRAIQDGDVAKLEKAHRGYINEHARRIERASLEKEGN